MSTTKAVMITAALVAAALVAAGCGGADEARPPAGAEVRGETTTVARTEVPLTVTATASLEAETSSAVSTRMMGWVRKVHVEAGDRVREGDPLVTIDDTDLRAKQTQAEAGITEARAVLENAERMLGRFERLYAEKSVSKAQLDEVATGRDRAAAALARAEAGLREVKVHLSYLRIVAPADGLIARRMVDPGDMANPGMPLLVLEREGRMKVVAHVGEKDVPRLAAGTPLTVTIPSLPDATYATEIARVVPTANPGSGTYDVEAYVEDDAGRLRSGMFARVRAEVGRREAVLVPRAALAPRGQLTGVWLRDADGTARLRWVRTGHERGDMVEILSGLDGGETLVVSAARPLVEGDKVVD